MALVLTVNQVHILTSGPLQNTLCSCQEAAVGCRPAFVFSIPGQVEFRTSLNHLKHCRKRTCVQLKTQVFTGIMKKLNWLIKQEQFLGCIKIQPSLYGSSAVTLKKADFPLLAHHLAHCPYETCAQLRRALLLTIRNEISDFKMMHEPRQYS